MNRVSAFLLACVMSCAFAVHTYAIPEDPCINVADVNVECFEYYGESRVTYEVSFKFKNVSKSTNFIRIYRNQSEGSTFTFPFKEARQKVTVRRNHCGWEQFTIDVYNIQPNGKAKMCRTTYSVWLCCEGRKGFDKDVVAGESQVFDVPAASLTLAPNPASDMVSISVDVPENDPMGVIDIVDITGNVVATLATGLSEGSTTFSAETLELEAGTYLIRMLHLNSITVRQLKVIR